MSDDKTKRRTKEKELARRSLPRQKTSFSETLRLKVFSKLKRGEKETKRLSKEPWNLTEKLTNELRENIPTSFDDEPLISPIERDREPFYYFKLGIPSSVFEHFHKKTVKKRNESFFGDREGEDWRKLRDSLTVKKLYRWFGLVVLFMMAGLKSDNIAYSAPEGYGINFPGKERILSQELHEWIKDNLRYNKKTVFFIFKRAWKRIVCQGGVEVDSDKGQDLASEKHYDRFDNGPRSMNWIIYWLEWGLLVAYKCYCKYVQTPLKYLKFLSQVSQDLLLRPTPKIRSLVDRCAVAIASNPGLFPAEELKACIPAELYDRYLLFKPDHEPESQKKQKTTSSGMKSQA